MNRWKILYLNCGERYKFMVDHRSYTHNLSSCKIKAWKMKFRPERDSNPWPLRYRCSALPVYSQENNLPHPVTENLDLFHVNCHTLIVIQKGDSSAVSPLVWWCHNTWISPNFSFSVFRKYSRVGRPWTKLAEIRRTCCQKVRRQIRVCEFL